MFDLHGSILIINCMLVYTTAIYHAYMHVVCLFHIYTLIHSLTARSTINSLHIYIYACMHACLIAYRIRLRSHTLLVQGTSNMFSSYATCSYRRTHAIECTQRRVRAYAHSVFVSLHKGCVYSLIKVSLLHSIYVFISHARIRLICPRSRLSIH